MTPLSFTKQDRKFVPITNKMPRRIQNAYGDKYDMLRMYDSKRSVTNLLNESAEERSLTGKTASKAERTETTATDTKKTQEQE